MSVAFNEKMHVYIKEAEGDRSPVPKPLTSGFSENKLYKVYGVYTPSETSECYFMLVNDYNEIWFISNRHLRFAGVL